MHSSLQAFIEESVKRFTQISRERREDLVRLAKIMGGELQARQSVDLVFICTHNSRRSQLCQAWAAAAASYFDVAGVRSFSGGTEVTEFNPRAVIALKEAGFNITSTKRDSNPIYEVSFAENMEPLQCFSKVYNESPPNPAENYLAMMTCAEADQGCPTVFGCSHRIALRYEDPKVADNTPEEGARYAERCAQIAREMLFLFEQVKVTGDRG